MYTQISQGPDASAFAKPYSSSEAASSLSAANSSSSGANTSSSGANSSSWGTRSLSWWITFILALGIIFLGIRFIIVPEAGADGFGISFANPKDDVYGKIKGIRDIFSGLVLLPLLWMRMHTATAWVFTAAIIIPVTDGLIVLATNGIHDIAHLSIHWGTALVMIATSVMLFRRPQSGLRPNS